MKLRQRSIRRSTSEMMKASLDEEPPHDMPNIATTGQQESHAATVVSPCKQSPKYTDVPKSAHQNTAPEVAGKVHNKQTTYINGMRPEKGKHRFDIQDETGYTESVNKANVVRVSSRAMHGVTVSTEKAAGNEGRDSAMSTSSAFQHSNELMIFPEVRISQDFHVHQHSNFQTQVFGLTVSRNFQPCFVNNQEVTDANPLAVQPTQALLELDYSNLDFLGERSSFDSSKDCEQEAPWRRRHSLDLSSPNENNNYKRFKQSQSLPHEQCYLNTAPITSFGSNSSGLTPIPIGLGVNPRAQNDAMPMKLNSSPIPLIAPPQMGVSKLFQPHSKVFINPKTYEDGGITGEHTGGKRHLCFAESYSDMKRHKLNLPPQLVPDDKEGRSLVVINGSSKQYTDAKPDANEADVSKTRESSVATTDSTNSHFDFLKNMYTALEGFTFLLPGLKKRASPNEPFNFPDLNIRVSSCGSFKLGHDRIPDNVSGFWIYHLILNLQLFELTAYFLLHASECTKQIRLSCCKTTYRKCSMCFWRYYKADTNKK